MIPVFEEVQDFTQVSNRAWFSVQTDSLLCCSQRCSDGSSHTYTAHTHFNQQFHTVSWGAVVLVMDRSNPWSPRGNRLPHVPPPGSGLPQTPRWPAELSVDGTHRYAPTGEATRTEGEGRGWFRWKGEEEEEIVAIKTVLVLIYSEYVFVCVSVSEVRVGGAKSNFYSLVSLSLHPSFFPVPMLFP